MRGVLAACALACVALGAPPLARATPDTPDLRVILSERPAPTLAAYRLFRDAGARDPNSGVTPYDLATPLFTDYADKRRYVFTPPGETARFDAAEVFAFPVGAVLVKTFEYDARPIETRLLVHKRDGWVALAYHWNAAGTEARLVQTGAQVPVTFTTPAGETRTITYVAPNANQCKGCHARGDQLTPIGPNARNLDRPLQYGDATENQLDHWTRAGHLSGVLADRPSPAPLWDASTRDRLDARARAYLDVNCSHCHRPDGPADYSGLDLRATQTAPFRYGVRKVPVAAGRAAADLRFAIEPGHPDRSILIHRMESTDSGVMMPELGRTIVHDEGVALISDWIAAMDSSGVAPH